MTYQQIRRSDFSLIGNPGPPHYAVDGWNDEALRNLDGTDERFGLRGTAFWPVIVSDPAYNPDTQALTDEVTGLVLDKKGFRFTGTWGVRDLTADEIAARNPVPEEVSSRQFFQQLAKDGDCTEAEALAYVQTGALPAVLSTVINGLPESIRFDVRMEVIGANEFYRSTPTVDLVGYLLGKDSSALDRIWRLASKL